MSNVRKTSASGAARGVVYDLAQARVKGGSVEAAAHVDSVGFSEAAHELARANAAVREAPDVREDRIQELKARIASGSYRPDPREIARQILDEGL